MDLANPCSSTGLIPPAAGTPVNGRGFRQSLFSVSRWRDQTMMTEKLATMSRGQAGFGKWKDFLTIGDNAVN